MRACVVATLNQCRCPHRKPRNDSLSNEQVEENDDFGGFRSVVENVFSRVKQFASMRAWRHKRHQHPIMARHCFQLTQVKNAHRPVRRIEHVPDRKQRVLHSWLAAERHGSAPVVTSPRKRSRARIAGDTDSDSEDDEPPRRRARLNRHIEEVLAANDKYERTLRAAHQAGERADRLARRARRRDVAP